MNSVKLNSGPADIASAWAAKKENSCVTPETFSQADTHAKTKRETFLTDWAVYALILFMGGIQFACYTHSADFLTDTDYPDLARSLLEHHSYQLNYLPMTTLPPGLPLILALVGRFWGLGPPVQFHVLAVSTTLGLIVAYKLLRLIEGRGLAAAACLLLGSSPLLFGFSTAIIFPEMPYLLASMLALWLTVKIDRAPPGNRPVALTLLLGLVLVMAVLIRSVGIALIVGLGTWLAASLLVVREAGRRRLKRFFLPLLLGVVAQCAWSVWAGRHEVLEWQLPGYPQSYISQLKLKNGHYPELGMATFSDIPRRVERNLVTRAAGFGQIMTRRYISPFWSSPAVFGVLFLILLGLASSFRNAGELHDWYFLWYEAMFLVWPWDYRDRFVFPIVPLACLYLWRGVKVARDYSIRRPKAVGVCFILCGVVLGVASVAFARGILAVPVVTDHPRGDHLQPIAAAFFWAMLAVAGLLLVRLHSTREARGDAVQSSWQTRIANLENSVSLRWAAILVLAVIVGYGIRMQLHIGRLNLRADLKQQATYGEIQAADWIQTHEPSNLIIMARDPGKFFHITGRRVVWFPPISNPTVLMDGIRRHHVGVVVVMIPPLRYWLPTEDVCFQSLARAYGSAFRLTHRDPNFQVYEVLLTPDRTSGASQQ